MKCEDRLHEDRRARCSGNEGMPTLRLFPSKMISSNFGRETPNIPDGR